MSQDEQHRQYFESNPQGNHEKMSESTKLAIEGLKQVLELKFTHITEKLDAIHSETKKTNGRVNKVEEIINLYDDMWDDQYKLRKDNRKWLADSIRKVIIYGCTVAFGVAGAATIVEKVF